MDSFSAEDYFLPRPCLKRYGYGLTHYNPSLLSMNFDCHCHCHRHRNQVHIDNTVPCLSCFKRSQRDLIVKLSTEVLCGDETTNQLLFHLLAFNKKLEASTKSSFKKKTLKNFQKWICSLATGPISTKNSQFVYALRPLMLSTM